MKKYSALIIVSTLVAMLLTACTSNLSPIPWDQIELTTEVHSEHVGSYHITRTNLGQQWGEWDDWESISFLNRPIVCFGYFSASDQADFQAANGYKWEEIEFDGRMCLELQKKK